MTAKEKFDLVGEAIALTVPNVKKCFMDVIGAGGGDEIRFIVIEFHGGAISVHNADANSQSANIKDVAQMINGGYYQEVQYYEQLKREEGK